MNTESDEGRADAWKRREAAAGSTDFTGMYVAHDAFGRDLARLADAAADGPLDDPALASTWQTFTRQLHVHHTAEDASLWPQVRSAVVAAADADVLDAMEAEHAALEPLIADAGDALGNGDPSAAVARLQELAGVLGAHMQHEERDALPLVERCIGQAGWDGFVGSLRRTQGVRGAAGYLPWVLDGAPATVRRRFLGALPPPARVIYRWRWEPRYRAGAHLR